MNFVLFQEKGLKYLLLDVECDAQGNFKDAQCGITLEKPHHHGCFCIDRTKWWSHLPGPMADNRTKVDCNMIKSGVYFSMHLHEALCMGMPYIDFFIGLQILIF